MFKNNVKILIQSEKNIVPTKLYRHSENLSDVKIYPPNIKKTKQF